MAERLARGQLANQKQLMDKWYKLHSVAREPVVFDAPIMPCKLKTWFVKQFFYRQILIMQNTQEKNKSNV